MQFSRIVVDSQLPLGPEAQKDFARLSWDPSQVLVVAQLIRAMEEITCWVQMQIAVRRVDMTDDEA